VKQILPVLFLLCFCVFPKVASAAISLTISNVEKSDSFYSVEALVSGLASSSSCFVQTVLTAPGDPHYFGKMWSQKGEWINYISSPEKEFITENFIKLENDQKIKILFTNDPDDSDYLGPGTYILKLKRYTGNSTSSAGESDNTLSVEISEVVVTPTDTPTPTPTSTNTPTATPTSSPTPTPTNTPTPIKTPTKATIKITPAPTSTPKISSVSSSLTPDVLGIATESVVVDTSPSIFVEATSPAVRKNNPVNSKYFFFFGVFLLLTSGSWLYFRHRND